MEITNIDVNGLARAMKSSGIPMTTGKVDVNRMMKKRDFERAEKLADVPKGSGHDCFLKGIHVAMQVRAPQYWWLQFGRYHHADIVSSQSKMHQIKNMDVSKQTNGYVDKIVIGKLRELITRYNFNKSDKNFQKVISNTPMGLELTADITTNYLQLKTMYAQRRNHRLQEWQYFCDVIENRLPRSRELITLTKEE